jgi:hypothetical protein
MNCISFSPGFSMLFVLDMVVLYILMFFFVYLLADLYVVEFQKRGLPHIHALVRLKADTNDSAPATIDSYTSAEIPDPNVDPLGYALVEEFMVHGPCGEYKTNSTCMKNGECSKCYPKDYNEETTIDGFGFPVYRRRNNGRYVTRNGIRLDNRWIVPHNMALLKKFQAHINVEWCSKTNLLKYMFKHLSKGHNMARARLHSMYQCPESTGINEIDDYAKYRYRQVFLVLIFLFSFSFPSWFILITHVALFKLIFFCVY